MGHLNELDDDYADRGLTVLGVTGEARSPTEEWVARFEMRYPYAYDPGGKLKRALDVGGIPHVLLVDPEGVVAWSGHPARLTKGTIEQALDGALTVPLWEWPKEARKVAGAVAEARFDRAFAEVEKLEAPLRDELLPRVRGLLDLRVKRLEAARDDGDWLAVEWRAKRLRGATRRLPEEELAKALLEDLRRDRAKRAVRDAQEDLRELEAKTDFGKRSKLERSVKKLEALRDEHAGTIVEREANERLVRWRAILASLED